VQREGQDRVAVRGDVDEDGHGLEFAATFLSGREGRPRRGAPGSWGTSSRHVTKRATPARHTPHEAPERQPAGPTAGEYVVFWLVNCDACLFRNRCQVSCIKT